MIFLQRRNAQYVARLAINLKYGFLNVNFKLEFWPTLNFRGYQIRQQTVHKVNKFRSHFHLKSKWKIEITSSSEQLVQISEELSTNKNKQNTAFDNGFYS